MKRFEECGENVDLVRTNSLAHIFILGIPTCAWFLASLDNVSQFRRAIRVHFQNKFVNMASLEHYGLMPRMWSIQHNKAYTLAIHDLHTANTVKLENIFP